MSGFALNPFGEIANDPNGGSSFVFSTPADIFAPTAIFGYSAGSGQQIVNPNTVAALQNSFVAQGTGGLAAITSIGAAEYSGAASLFSNWAQNISNLSNTVASTQAEAVSKSATACSGFFGCLF